MKIGNLHHECNTERELKKTFPEFRKLAFCVCVCVCGYTTYQESSRDGLK